MQLSQEEIENLVKKVNQIAHDSDNQTDLTQKEIDTLREVIEAWFLWKNFGRISKLVIWGLLTIAGAMIAWRQVKEEFMRWLGLM